MDDSLIIASDNNWTTRYLGKYSFIEVQKLPMNLLASNNSITDPQLNYFNLLLIYHISVFIHRDSH